MNTLPVPDEPLRIALIGAGGRAQSIYKPLWESLAPWCRPVAVCDPVSENGDTYAAALGVPAYRNIRKLVHDRPMEAAVVVTPVPSHHSISVFLSSNGIPNHIETSWASTVWQAREMISTARANNVLVRVGENFFRFPIDRFAQTLRDDGYLGRIGRIVSYADHTGYHNNSRWIVFAGSHPEWVQSVSHDMSHPGFYSRPQRYHEKETLKCRFFSFPDGFFVMDTGSGHVKGHLGRHPRPGYTEWQGERGTLVYRAQGVAWGNARAELRYVSDAKLAPAQEAAADLRRGGHADVITPVENVTEGDVWLGMHADTPQRRIEYKNQLRTDAGVGKANDRVWYGMAVMEHIVDFVLAVRGLRESEFIDEDALMSSMMEVGALESALQNGRRVELPLGDDLESDSIILEKERAQLGVDPLDVDAMLSVSFPTP